MKKFAVLLLSVAMIVGLASAKRLVADRERPAEGPVATLDELSDDPSMMNEEIQAEVPEDAFLYQAHEQEAPRAVWEFERDLPVEVVDRRVVVDTNRDVVKSSYLFDVGRDLDCRRVLNYLTRVNDADSVARQKGLFDVCENVRSVGRDQISLQWNDGSLHRTLTVEVERDKRDVQVTYKMPFLGH